MSYKFTAEDMNGLTREQKAAIVDAVVAGALADGTLQTEEISTFDAEFSKVPWGLPEAEIDQMIRAAHGKITAIKDAKEVIIFLAGTADKIPVPVREKAFAMACAVAYADKKMNEAELHVLNALAGALGLTRERLVDIAASVKGG